MVPLPPGVTGPGLHFSSPYSAFLYGTETASFSRALSCPGSWTPSIRHPHVLGNGISWSLVFIISYFTPSQSLCIHTHTHIHLSFQPVLVRSLKKKQKRPCSLHCPFPSLPPPFPLSPPSCIHLCPLSLERSEECWESPGSAKPGVVWGVSSDSSLFSPSRPPLTTCHYHQHPHSGPCDRLPSPLTAAPL